MMTIQICEHVTQYYLPLMLGKKKARGIYNVALNPFSCKSGPRTQKVAPYCSTPNATTVGEEVCTYWHKFIHTLKKVQMLLRQFSPESRLVEDFF